MGGMSGQKVCYHESVLSSPLEVALRMLILLSRLSISADLQRLSIYDYLLLHSQDTNGGPPSLHPATPVRTGELLVRRNQITRGLYLLESRGLVERDYLIDGIGFRPSKLASTFLEYFDSPYAKICSDISSWVAAEFDKMTTDELQEYIRTRIGQWGVEFTDEPVEDENLIQ
jgi:hypothetical protein